MQRAAASSSPSTPQSQSEEAQPPPSKRQRTSQTDDTADSRTNEISTIQIVLDEEEQRRVNAVDKLAEDAGETKWVLSTVNEGMDENQQQLRVATAGYSDIDEGVWRPAGSARRSFGRFNRDLEVSFYKFHCLSQALNTSQRSFQANGCRTYFRSLKTVPPMVLRLTARMLLSPETMMITVVNIAMTLLGLGI